MIHPVYVDPAREQATSVQDWLEIFTRHLNESFEPELEAIVATLNFISYTLKDPQPAEQPLIGSLIATMFFEKPNLPAFSFTLYSFVNKQSTQDNYLIPLTPLSYYQKIISLHPIVFINFLSAIVDFERIHHFPCSTHSATSTLLHIVQTVLDSTYENGELFMDKFAQLSESPTLQELNLGLIELLRSLNLINMPEGGAKDVPYYVCPANRADDNSIQYSIDLYHTRMSEIFDENGVLNTWGIIKHKLTVASGKNEISIIYRRHGKLKHNEYITDEVLAAIRNSMRELTNPEYTFPSTQDLAYLRAIDAKQCFDDEADKPNVFTKQPYLLSRSALKNEKKSEVIKNKKVHFAI